MTTCRGKNLGVTGPERASSSRLGRNEPLNIAMLAPPWIRYASRLRRHRARRRLAVRRLVELGHRVTLFAAPGSRSSATVREVLARSYPDVIGQALYESDHVSRVLDMVDEMAEQGEPFDILHDHCGFTTVAIADRIPIPVIHTLHGPFTEDTSGFYSQHRDHTWLVAISEAQRPRPRPMSRSPE